MMQSQIMLMAEEAAWKADLAARRERVSRMYGKPRRHRVPAMPVLHLPRRHGRRVTAVA